MDFFVSDTHFNHANIIKFAERPFGSWEKMNEVLINNWNKRVSKDDTVYHLGDFGFQNREIAGSAWSLRNIFNELNGNKILIKGNHDKSPVLELPWRNVFNQLRYPMVENPGPDNWFQLIHKPTILDNSAAIHLIGHIHQQFIYQGNNLNMSVEVWGYQPVTLEEINNRIDWLKTNVYDTNTKMKLFGKKSKFNEDILPPIPKS